MPSIAEQIAQARGYGDLSENAEYDAAMEAQGMLQARINDLQDKLARALIVDKSTLPTDRVVFGSQSHPSSTSTSTTRKTSSSSDRATRTMTRTRSSPPARLAKDSSARRSARSSRSPYRAEP